jgi:hypothetical protein
MPGRIVLSGLCLVTAATLGCGPGEGVLATIGDAEVSSDAFQQHIIEVTGGPWEGVSDAVASSLFDQYLDREVLLAAAAKDGADDRPAGTDFRSARVRLLLDELCGPPPPPSAREVEREIEQAQTTDRPARAHVRQMLLGSLEDAEAARAQLDEGADFVELSQRVSRAPNASDGGELGFLTQGGLSEELDEVIFSLAAGEISAPVQGPSGYHIFQVLEVVPAGPPPRDEIEPEVRQRLVEEAGRRHSAECVRELARTVGIRVIHEHLWFSYQGRYSEEIHAD